MPIRTTRYRGAAAGVFVPKLHYVDRGRTVQVRGRLFAFATCDRAVVVPTPHHAGRASVVDTVLQRCVDCYWPNPAADPPRPLV